MVYGCDEISGGSGMNQILKKDIHGKPIREGQEFKFKFLESLHNPIDLKGKFYWHEDELRYEIDIIGSREYTCLSYVGNGVMYDFELLEPATMNEPNIQKTTLTAEHTAEYKKIILEICEAEYRVESTKKAVYNELNMIFKKMKEKYGI